MADSDVYAHIILSVNPVGGVSLKVFAVAPLLITLINDFLPTVMARLDQVITNIVDIFLDYADDEGKKKTLNKEELKKVLEKEIQTPELKVRD